MTPHLHMEFLPTLHIRHSLHIHSICTHAHLHSSYRGHHKHAHHLYARMTGIAPCLGTPRVALFTGAFMFCMCWFLCLESSFSFCPPGLQQTPVASCRVLARSSPLHSLLRPPPPMHKQGLASSAPLHAPSLSLVVIP